MRQTEFDFEGQRLKQEGMMKAADHADRVDNGWKDRCYYYFRQWLLLQPSGATFRFEDFKEYAFSRGLEKPVTGNAFGHIPQRAARDKLIVKNGVDIGKLDEAHAGFVVRWKKI